MKHLKKMAEKSFSLIGHKVLLRPFLVADISNSYIDWLNDSKVVKFSNQRFLEHDRNSCLHYQASFEGTDNLFMGVFSLSDNRLIGTLTAYVSSHHGTVDVGIMIGDHSVWGMGYGQDAWDTMVNWLLKCKKIRKLTAGTLACNLAMIKIMEHSGMVMEATRKAQEIVEGLPIDILYYAKFSDN